MTENMTDPFTQGDGDTTPPPTPGDRLVGRVLLLVGIIAILCVGGIILLAVMELAVPQILEITTTGAVTGLVALLAGRTQR